MTVVDGGGGGGGGLDGGVTRCRRRDYNVHAGALIRIVRRVVLYELRYIRNPKNRTAEPVTAAEGGGGRGRRRWWWWKRKRLCCAGRRRRLNDKAHD